MVVFLVGLGVALVAVGVVVLIKWPDRPGGVVRFRGLEVGSNGAGLPLVVVGVVLAVVAATTIDSSVSQTAGDNPTSSDPAGRPAEVAGLDAPPHPACTNSFFEQEPRMDAARVRSVELHAEDRQVLGTGEPQDVEFGLVLSDTITSSTPVVLGAMKLSWRSGPGFT